MKYQILSGNAFVDFDDVRKLKKRSVFHCTFSDNSFLNCTLCHRLELADGTFKSIGKLSEDDVLKNGQHITNITYIGMQDVYDVVNSKTKTYNTNNVVSHNCTFVGSSHTLIESSILSTLTYDPPIFQKDDLYYFTYPVKDHIYTITVDVSRGRGLDYSAFSVIDVTCIPYQIVATYKNNTINTLMFPGLIDRVGKYYNNALILLENNDLGEAVANSLWFDMEYDNLVWTHNEKISSHGVIGVKTTHKVKEVGTTTLKNLIENHQLVLHDFRIIQELNGFIRQKKGLYGAQDIKINDDLCSTLWLFGWLTKQSYFVDLSNTNPSEEIAHKYIKATEDYIPIGFRIDGSEDYDPKLYTMTSEQQELLNS